MRCCNTKFKEKRRTKSEYDGRELEKERDMRRILKGWRMRKKVKERDDSFGEQPDHDTAAALSRLPHHANRTMIMYSVDDA
jgi:hypothetical protein